MKTCEELITSGVCSAGMKPNNDVFVEGKISKEGIISFKSTSSSSRALDATDILRVIK